MKYIPLFILIQLVSLVLTIVGIPVIAALSLFDAVQWAGVDGSEQWARWHWKFKWAWIWDNDVDGVTGNFSYSPWEAFYWSAIRNPCNNLRFVKGVSKVGRPLWKVVFKSWYAQAGWNDKGEPVLSAGHV
jgi:hypothetical protein